MRAWSIEEVLWVEALRSLGLSAADVGRWLGRTEWAVSNAITRHGLTIYQTRPVSCELTAARAQRLRRLWTDGYDRAGLQRLLGCSRTTLGRWLQELELPRRRGCRPPDPKRRDLIVALRRDGLSPAEIRARIGVSTGVVMGHLWRAGLCKRERTATQEGATA